MGLRPADFRPASGLWFTSFLAEALGSLEGCAHVSLDLGLSTSLACVEGGILRAEGLEAPLDSVMPSERDRVVLLERGRRPYEVVMATESAFYKLKAVRAYSAPTVEISGIHMHRISGVDPWEDAARKARAARISRGDRVLDTCTGLGYTALASVAAGASEVDSFEVDPAVLWIAERNPWSRGLASGRVRVFLQDVVEAVHELPNGRYHKAIHDPPRFSGSTGDLYSLEFYRELYRVLRPGGRLFHYTGEPRVHGGPRLLKGIRARLEKAGFIVLGFDRASLGFVAAKPWS
ncbi:MAG: methyltransferase [Desulfurococcaceae archaeon]